MPRISKLLIVLGVIFTIFILLIVYRYLNLPPAYEFLPSQQEDVKTWIPPTIEEIPSEEGKG